MKILRKSTNLSLRTDLAEEGTKLAKARYDCSLSRLVERLILAEVKRKRGVQMRGEVVP
jgi:hypothetical protein